MTVVVARSVKQQDLELVVLGTDSQCTLIDHETGETGKDRMQKIFTVGPFLLSAAGDYNLVDTVLHQLRVRYLTDSSRRKAPSAETLAFDIAKILKGVYEGILDPRLLERAKTSFVLSGPSKYDEARNWLTLHHITTKIMPSGMPYHYEDSTVIEGSGATVIREEHNQMRKGYAINRGPYDTVSVFLNVTSLVQKAAADMRVGGELQLGVQVLRQGEKPESHILLPEELETSEEAKISPWKRVELFMGKPDAELAGEDVRQEAIWLGEFYHALTTQLRQNAKKTGVTGSAALDKQTLESLTLATSAMLSGSLQQMHEAVRAYHRLF